mgnify:CR=1 FL=1
MLIALTVMAAAFGLLLLATLALSKDRLAAGIRGTVRYGVLGVAFFLPLLAVVALVAVCVYAFVAGVLYAIK